MTEVSFYHLTKNPLEKALPGLLERALGAGHRIVVRAVDGGLVRFLDESLWAYGDTAFLPHGIASTGHAEAQPVYITDKIENPNGAGVLVAINNADTSDFQSYARVLYMFDGHDGDVLDGARQRWKQFKADGADLTYWQQSPEGRWLKKDI